jgi:hypothetical protein
VIRSSTLIALLFGCLMASAAEESTLRGKIRSSGVPLPGIRVEVVPAAAGRTLIELTNADDEFRITGLHAGETVVVSAGATGFVSSQRSLTLRSGENTADIILVR